ncbi:hypothetical protein BpHYR1_043733 [Brachionus plicatilis]|uniref:Uncharacterized protein n=1 Tax=Brachionus plicatilis TaxID=10195 RepID=A0A3M7PI71_BRAPC|nr:hypothetical protein BpHYR1_043733 [Brachionus plicatilis]
MFFTKIETVGPGKQQASAIVSRNGFFSFHRFVWDGTFNPLLEIFDEFPLYDKNGPSIFENDKDILFEPE